MDVDVGGMSPGADGAGITDLGEGAKDGEGEEIVRQLERGLPKWEGFGDKGWMSEGNTVSCTCAILLRMTEIMSL
jgi:chromatin structure-remodeling complex subunit RSC1/2